MILTPEQLQDLGMAVFREAGVPEESAASVVEALVRAELDGSLTRVLPHSLLCGSGSVRQGKSAGHSAGASGCSCGRAGGCGKRVRFSGHSGGAGKSHTSGAPQRGVRIGSHPVAPLRRGWAVCGTDRGKRGSYH